MSLAEGVLLVVVAATAAEVVAEYGPLLDLIAPLRGELAAVCVLALLALARRRARRAR